MSIELSVLLIVAAGIGGFLLGRFTKLWSGRSWERSMEKAMLTASVGLKCYDCEENNAVVNVSDAPASLAAYAWDNSGGGASPKDIPPAGSKYVSAANGEMDIPDVPHENNATKILLQIWSVHRSVDVEIDCDNNSWACSSESSGSSSTEGVSQASVLP